MIDIAELKIQSADNLRILLNRVQRFKVKNSDAEVDLVLKSLPVYHCVRDSNIIEVLKSQELKIKNQVVLGEHTNMSTDFFQGFENHLSMSVGEPWIEYGQYAFAFGLEHISDDSLAFSDDPWLWGSEKFQKNTLLKDDFIIYARECLKRNLRRVNKKFYVQIPWKTNLHKLAKTNFCKWEIKHSGNLKITDAEEFFVWNNIDHFVAYFVKIFTSPFMIGVGLLLFALMIWGLYL